jgi:hypothetical protein
MKARHTFQTLFRLVLVSLLVVSGTASAEDAKGMLKVSTDKGEATVYLGLEEVGQAPMQQYMDTGTYTIRVLKDGFEPYVRKIHIRPNQATSVTAKLFPGKGSVEFLVEPSGAELTLNKSKETFNTPVRLKDLKEGAYTYTLSAPGHETEKGKFTFRKGKNVMITAQLQSSAGLVSVISRPKGATVLLDGRDVGMTPLALEDIEAGEHSVQIMKRGYASVFRRFDTSDGSKGEIEARLPKRGAPLTVRTGEKESTLVIQGMKFGGQSSYRFGPVERGRYALVISAEDKKIIEQTVEVPIKGTALYRAKLRPKGGNAPSVLTKGTPFYKHWLFYTAVGGTLAAGGAIAAIAATSGGSTTIQSSPAGDILITLP